METNLMRFLEMSVQTFALASVWRSASSMVTPGTMLNEPLALLPTLEPFTIPVTLLAVIGSVAATHIGIRGWRKLRRAINKERSDLPASISQPLHPAIGRIGWLRICKIRSFSYTRRRKRWPGSLKKKRESAAGPPHWHR